MYSSLLETVSTFCAKEMKQDPLANPEPQY